MIQERYGTDLVSMGFAGLGGPSAVQNVGHVSELLRRGSWGLEGSATCDQLCLKKKCALHPRWLHLPLISRTLRDR